MTLNYWNLGVDSISTLGRRTVETSEKPQFAPLVADNPLLAKLKQTHNEFFSVFKKGAFSGMGDDIKAADLKRDDYFRGIYRIASAYSKMEAHSLQQDAKNLLPLFEPYGLRVAQYSYGDESAELHKLMEALDKPGPQAKLEKLNMKEAYTLFKKSQTDFETLFSTQAGANASLHETESATSLKGKMITDLRNYLGMVNAMRDVDAWKPLYAELNELVKAAAGSSIIPPKVILPPPPKQP